MPQASNAVTCRQDLHSCLALDGWFVSSCCHYHALMFAWICRASVTCVLACFSYSHTHVVVLPLGAYPLSG